MKDFKYPSTLLYHNLRGFIKEMKLFIVQLAVLENKIQIFQVVLDILFLISLAFLLNSALLMDLKQQNIQSHIFLI